MIEQEILSTVFDKKLFSCSKIEKMPGQNQSTCGLLCSAFDSRGKRDFFPRLFLTMSVRSDNVERLGVVLYDNDVANGVQR